MRNRLFAPLLLVVTLVTTTVVSIPSRPASAATTRARVPSAGDNVFAYGHASFYGSTGPTHLAHSIVGIESTPSGRGYWLVASDGGMFSFGDARFRGSTGAMRLNAPIVGMASTPSGRGYWLVASDGGMFSFGDARFRGSTGAMRLNAPIVGMASTPSGRGYWLVASDGGMFSFGDARFRGSTGAMRLNAPIVGMASTPSGRGYWLVASDGGMFSFGDARFRGSTGAMRLNAPIAGMVSTPSGHGYRLVARDGRVFSYGDARVGTRPHPSGTRASNIGNTAVVGIAAGANGRGFWLAADGGAGSKAEAAIDWFESRLGSSEYEGLCETAVELAYGTIHQYDTAAENWYARSDKHFDWQNAPRGALVFYNTSGRGHVAISLGDGRVVSTSISHRIAVAPTGFLQNPLGWAPAPW